MAFTIPEAAFAPFYQTPVAFYGERAGARKLGLPVKCSVVEDSPLNVTDSAAPVRARTFDVAFPRASWPFPTPPEIGEWMQIEWNGGWLWSKANSVDHLPNGDLTVSAVQTSEEMGGPPWLR